MIKINLIPPGENDSRLWYIPELITVFVVFATSWYGVQIYLDEIQVKVDASMTRKSTLQANLNTITQETSRYDQLDKDISKLRTKLSSLKEITSSKIVKYKQIIVLEHLQNLKPDGVWYNYISEVTPQNKITLVGKAFDNILIAELMSAIQATQTQEADPTDLRTQIYFSSLVLERAATNGAVGITGAAAPADGGLAPPLAGTAVPLNAEESSEYWAKSDGDFPELAKFPAFQLTMKYEERKVAPGRIVP